MLVLKLSYKDGAILQTSDGPIRVCVCRRAGEGCLRVGFEAPPAVKILRESLLDREDGTATPGRG